MQRSSVYKKTYGTKSKQQAARAAVARARATILSNRRSVAPLRTGGFWGVSQRRQQELKVLDSNAAGFGSACDTTGAVTLINGIATGTDFNARIGRKIVMKSLYMRGWFRNVDLTCSDSAIRIVAVYDAQTNGAAPTWSDVFTTSDPLAHINLNNRDRFKILYDKSTTLGGISNAATQAFSTSGSHGQIKKYLKLNHEVIFSGTGATVGSIASGSIYILTLGTAAPNDGGYVTISTRIRFVDA